MPKPILKQSMVLHKSNNILDVSIDSKQKKSNNYMDKMKIDKLLRRSRSKKYMEIIQNLDAGGQTCNQNQIDKIIDEISREFPEIDIKGILLGFVAICYLGEPYEVHMLDITGKIIEHYQKGHALPNGLEKARSIALRGGYSFIEVYVDCCRAVSSNGMVSVIPC